MKKIKFLVVLALVFSYLNCTGQGRPAIEYHNPSITYNADDLVVKDGTIFRATATTSDTPPTANWEALGGAEADPVYMADYWDIQRYSEDIVLAEAVNAQDILKVSATTGTFEKASALDADAGKNRYLFAKTAGQAGDTITGYNQVAYKGNNSLTYGDPIYISDAGRATTTLPSGTAVQIGVVEYDWYGYWTDTDKYYHIDFNRNYGTGGGGAGGTGADTATRNYFTMPQVVKDSIVITSWFNDGSEKGGIYFTDGPNDNQPADPVAKIEMTEGVLGGLDILNTSPEAPDVSIGSTENGDVSIVGSNLLLPFSSINAYQNTIEAWNFQGQELIAYDNGQGYDYAAVAVSNGPNRVFMDWNLGDTYFRLGTTGYYTNIEGDFRVDKTTAQIDAGNVLGLVNQRYVLDKVAAAGGGVTDHTQLTNIGTNTHAQIDSHIADGTTHYTQGAISITESQISDLAHTVDTDTQLSQAQVGAYAEAEGFLKNTSTNINTDTITYSQSASSLKVLSEDSYPELWLGSTSSTWGGSATNQFARMELGYGKIDFDGNFYYAADPQATYMTFSPGTGSWFLAVRENESGDGGTRANWITEDVTASTYTILWDGTEIRDSDEGKVFFGNSATAQTFTLPSDTGLNTWVRDGWNITIFQRGAGQITIETDNVGDTLNVPAGYEAKTAGQFSAVTVVFHQGEFYITGSLATTP